MTNPHELRRAESRGVDTDRMDGGSRLWRRATVAVGIGLVVGAAVGGVVGATSAPSYDATTALSVLPDSVIDTGQQNTTAPELDATAYIQGQLVSLNGAEVANSVQRRLGLASSPSVSATQVGQTYVVDVTATASTEAQAKRIATTTGSVYAQLRTAALTKSINAQLQSTNARLATVQKNLAAAQKGAKPGANVTPAQTALQTEYERLLTLDSSLNLALPQVGQLVTVQSSAHVLPASLSPTLLSAAIGGLVGALVGVIVLLAYGRISPRIRTVGDVVDLDLPMLLPVLPRAGRKAKNGGAWRSNPVRLVGARLAASGEHHVLVVVGATARVGTSYIAAGLAAAAAPRGPVLLIQAGSGAPSNDESAPASQVVASTLPGVWLLPGAGRLAGADAQYVDQAETLTDVVQRATASGWFVIVDAPSLAESDLALDCLRNSESLATLVIARGLSRPADVLSAAELLESSGRFAGALLNDAPHGVFARRAGSGADLVAVRGERATATVTDSAPQVAGDAARSDRPRPAPAYQNGATTDRRAQSEQPPARDESAAVPRRS